MHHANSLKIKEIRLYKVFNKVFDGIKYLNLEIIPSVLLTLEVMQALCGFQVRFESISGCQDI